MTNKEKWKQAISTYISESDILTKIKDRVHYPYVKLSSVQMKKSVREKIQCPYCFGITTIKSLIDDFNSSSDVECSCCGHRFNKGRSTGKNSYTKIYFGDRSNLLGEIIYIDEATICGYRGLIYIYIDSADVVYDMNKKRRQLSFRVRSFGFLSLDCRFYYCDGKFTTRSISLTGKYWAEQYYTVRALDLLTQWLEWDDPVESMNAMSAIMQIEQPPSTSPRPERSYAVKKSNEIIEMNPVCDVSELPEIKYTGIRADFCSFDTLKNETVFNGYCYDCGKNFRYRVPGRYNRNDRVCPQCGKQNTVYLERDERIFYELHIDQCDNGDYVFRLMQAKTEAGKKELLVQRIETDRVYVRTNTPTPKWASLYRDGDGNMRYRKNDEISTVSIKPKFVLVSDRADHALKYSGLKAYIDSAKEGELMFSDVVKYISVWLIHSFIEKIIKLKWKNMTDHIVCDVVHGNRVDFNEQGKAMHDILRLNKLLVKYLAETNADPAKNELDNLRMYYEMDPNVIIEDLGWCKTEKISTYALKEVIEILDINVHHAYEYLERVRISQCYNPKEAIVEWRDYLKACQTIDVDLADKTVRYPSSLKREHDKAVFKQKVIYDKRKESSFIQTCASYGEKYGFENEQYQIIVPSSMQDLFEEGRKLNHCVETYADRIIMGRSCICFVRSKEEPEIPYFTVEIYPEQESVSQIRGLSNRNIDSSRDIGLAEFLKAWAKKKKLVLSAA